MSSAGLAVSRIRAEELVISPRFFHNALDLNLNEQIMVYLSVSGNMIPMRVFEMDSIECVKLRIQSCKGFVVRNQKLICGGRELSRSNWLIRDYGVGNGNVLHLVLRLSDLQMIKVRTVSGKELCFNGERYRDVAYVKKQIAKCEKGFDEFDTEDAQELLYEGEELKDKQLINDICKESDAVIHFVVRKSVKVRTKHIDKNFELSIDATEAMSWRKCNVQCDEPIFRDEMLCDKNFMLEPVVVNSKIEMPSAILDVIAMTYKGLDSRNDPIRSAEGSGGAYLMQDSTGLEYVSVFKPIDEEPKAMNNPQGLPPSSAE